MMNKPWQFNLRSLMVLTLKLGVLAALFRYGTVQPYYQEARRQERELPRSIARQVIRRQQAAIPTKVKLRPDQSVRTNRLEWHLVSRCKEVATDSQFLWNLELRGTSGTKVVTALNHGGIHNEKFLQDLAAEYGRLGLELEIKLNEEMPASH